MKSKVTNDLHSSSDRLFDLFSRLVLVPGISRREHDVAGFIREELGRIGGFIIREDDAGSKIGGSTGNLFIHPPDFDPAAPCIVFMAHMDTVRDTSGIRVIQENGMFRSDGSSQLGADNRAGVAILLDLLSDAYWLRESGVNLLVIFSVAEEIGLMGASQLDLSGYNVDSVYVFDSSRRPGAYIRECAGNVEFTVVVSGRAAHSAVNPEDGISAIKLAAAAVSRMRTGRLAEMTTVNIGRMEGGEANNIVAPKCRVVGEVRAPDMNLITELLGEIKLIFTEEARMHGGTIEFSWKKDFAPYVHREDARIVLRAEEAIRRAGLEVVPLKYAGGSDANVINELGYPAINLGIGAQKPHADDEFILEEDLVAARAIAGGLVQVHLEAKKV